MSLCRIFGNREGVMDLTMEEIRIKSVEAGFHVKCPSSRFTCKIVGVLSLNG
jgi:hypothetical protein